MEVSNQSMVKELILLGFPIAPRLQILFFAVFLIAYLLALPENIIIILTLWTTNSLHSPMNFFLSNLSFLAICYVTVTLPKTMLSFVSGCMTKLYFFLSLGNTDCLLLTLVAYNCYVAICKPFHYSTIIRHAVHLTMGSWLTGFLISGCKVFFISQLMYCRPNKINHFFCDVSPLLKLACRDMERAAFMDFVAALFSLLMPLSIIILSNTMMVQIFFLKLQGTDGYK